MTGHTRSKEMVRCAMTSSKKKAGGKQAKNPVPNGEKTQFKPGQSGNPKGRPKGPSMKTVLEKFLSQSMDAKDPILGENRKMTVQERIVLSWIGAAMKQNIHAINSIVDRVDGKITEKIEQEITGDFYLKKRLLDD
jgi:hypothetical protein